MFSSLKENFLKIKSALSSTSNFVKLGLSHLFKAPWSAHTLEELEALLYKTDMGSSLVEKAISHIKKQKEPKNVQELESYLIQFGEEILKKSKPLELNLTHTPTIILIVGTNGSGKTTFCAKLAHLLLKQNKSVIFGAADTFRAAAVQQLEHFGQCLGIDTIKHGPGADPAAVCFDTIKAAVSRKTDVVILDSSGRLENKLGLMAELKKIHQSCHKALEKAPHYTLLNLDASLGQSALIQAKAFHEASPLSGLILSKFDGSAKGGMILSLMEHMQLPIAFLGTGEKLEDLATFDEKSYLEAIFKSS